MKQKVSRNPLILLHFSALWILFITLSNLQKQGIKYPQPIFLRFLEKAVDTVDNYLPRSSSPMR